MVFWSWKGRFIIFIDNELRSRYLKNSHRQQIPYLSILTSTLPTTALPCLSVWLLQRQPDKLKLKQKPWSGESVVSLGASEAGDMAQCGGPMQLIWYPAAAAQHSVPQKSPFRGGHLKLSLNMLVIINQSKAIWKNYKILFFLIKTAKIKNTDTAKY